MKSYPKVWPLYHAFFVILIIAIVGSFLGVETYNQLKIQCDAIRGTLVSDGRQSSCIYIEHGQIKVIQQ